jgi:DNA polymerase III subunit epsilon
MTRKLIVVDVETTGLHETAAILEVAAVNVETGDAVHFVPFVSKAALGDAEPIAMQINRYFERGVWKAMLDFDKTKEAYADIALALEGHAFAGSNPAFDSQLLRAAIRPIYGGPLWHYRLADLAAYAAGVLRIPPTELPGLEAVCTALGVKNKEPHSAMGDAVATAECFRQLMSKESK